MRVIGITGGIGSGKSSVLTYMQDRFGAVLCETDRIAHHLQKPGAVCYQDIVACFGNEILAGDGTIDRKLLGAVVFADPARLALLNEIVHPAVKREVRRQMREAAQKGTELFLIESALLMEDHYEEFCSELWYIYANETVRRERLKSSRALSDEKICRIMQTQAEEAAFRAYCHVVIDNSGAFEETKRQIEQAVNRR